MHAIKGAVEACGAAREHGGEDEVAHRRGHAAAGAVVVGCAPGHHAHAPLVVSPAELRGHVVAQPTLARVCGERRLLGERRAVGSAVAVDTLHAHEQGIGRLGRREHAVLQGGEELGPLVVLGVEALVDDGCSRSGPAREHRIARIAREHLDAGRGIAAGEPPRAVHHAHRQLAAAQGLHGGTGDRPGAEDHVEVGHDAEPFVVVGASEPQLSVYSVKSCGRSILYSVK